MKKKVFIASAVALLGPFAQASDQPTVNLGSTSFMDVAPNVTSNWAFSQYLQYYSADKITDKNGNRVPLPEEKLDVLGSINQLIYLSSKREGVPRWGINVIWTQTLASHIDDGLDNARLKAQNGLGDLRIGPYLLSDTVMRDGRPFFTQRSEFDVVIPGGKYNRADTINPGNNVWAINPYWAATIFPTQNWSASVRLHYLWSGINDKPPTSLGPTARTVQAGQAVHANFATSYAVGRGFRVGINGYWLDQFTDSKVNGQRVDGRRERVFAIGPGALWLVDPQDHLYFNFYQESAARNRPEGSRAVVRYMHIF